MPSFRLSPAARADLEEIWDYTAGRWGGAQAEAYALAIRDACRGLADGTRISRAAGDVRPGYRKALVGSHIRFFRPSDDGTLGIIRVLHKNMDVSRRLAENGH